ncbi:hypothetical protein F9Z43_10945 [Pseudomonas monteilii]|uniref:Uncharacterized protein n=1 Tax=Pseudomonas monteilii TaxID=76759 RepID=A0A7X3F1M3_9PSED|nr:hypothetical protein [Pseudomonas monteilii]
MKKSTMVSAAEKYASEIEIFTFGRGFRTQISRSSVQKRRFNQSMTGLFGRTDFFNRVGRFLPVRAYPCAVQIRCKQLVKSSANGWSSPCNYAASTDAAVDVRSH